MRARLAIGVGCRCACPADAILAVIRDACATLDFAQAALFSSTIKSQEPGLHEAAAALGWPLTFLPVQDLAAVADRLTQRSPRVEAATGLPSVAEAAALAGAGAGGRLVVPRVAHAAATCAVAVASEEEA